MNRQETLSLLAAFNIRPTRSLGQNFLVDERVVVKICELADLSTQDLVIEIGPGIGGLTRELATRAGQVIALEIDKHVMPALQQVLSHVNNCKVVLGDALEADLARLAEAKTDGVKVVANLPYYITTPLIEKILVELPDCSQLVLMVQKEAAARIMANPGSKQYGPLAVLTASFGEVRREILVPADAFYPRPDVESCVVRITASHQMPIDNWKKYLRFLEHCFAQRRRTLTNSLSIAGVEPGRQKLAEILSELGLKSNIRAEMLEKEQFLAIYNRLYRQK